MSQFDDAFRFIMKDAKRDMRRLGWTILGLLILLVTTAFYIGTKF